MKNLTTFDGFLNENDDIEYYRDLIKADVKRMKTEEDSGAREMIQQNLDYNRKMLGRAKRAAKKTNEAEVATELPKQKDMVKMFQEINKDCAETGETVRKFSDEEYYSQQIQNIYDVDEEEADLLAHGLAHSAWDGTEKIERIAKMEESAGSGNVRNEIEDLFHVTDVFNELVDEGYLDEWLRIKEDVTVKDIDDYLKDQKKNWFGRASSQFETEGGLDNAVNKLKSLAATLAAKLERRPSQSRDA